MYIDTLAYQTREFFYSLGFGFILGIIYDLTRILRLCVYNGRKKVFIFDIIFAVVAAFLSMIFVLGVCRGKFASYVVLGATAGFAVYGFSIGRLTKALSERISSALRHLFSMISGFIGRKFHFFIKKIAGLVKKTKNNKKKSKNNSKKDLQEE